MLMTQQAATAHQPQTSNQSPVGTNLHPPADWSSEYIFVDAFKTSRPWVTRPGDLTWWDTNERDLLDLDENGWVRSLPDASSSLQFRAVSTLMFTRLGGNYPTGTYNVYYEGEGTIVYGNGAVLVQSLSGHDVIEVDPSTASAGILLTITETNPSNYIRNIRVIMPGFSLADADKFHPDFLASLDSYSVLRFMDWMKTNYALDGERIRAATRAPQLTEVHPLDQTAINPRHRLASADVKALWQARNKPEFARYTEEAADGIPIEIMINLANQQDADPWFNMPHQANNNYIWNFADLTLKTLEPNRNVYIEYSNEVWNSGFGQGAWVEKQAIAEWGRDTGQEHVQRWEWYAQRSAEMCRIWKDTWGADADRVICVLGSQATVPNVTEKMLLCQRSTLSPCYNKFDAIAVAPYFGQHVGHNDNLPHVTAWLNDADGGLSRLFAELNYGSQLPHQNSVFSATIDNIMAKVVTQRELATTYGLALIGYEGGQHLVAGGNSQSIKAVTDLYSNANRDERMRVLYLKWFEAWRNSGGELIVHYNGTGVYSQWGNWGAQESYTAFKRPKVTSIGIYAVTATCPWSYCEPVSADFQFELYIPLLQSNCAVNDFHCESQAGSN